VAYLECAKGGGPWGLGDFVPQKLTFFVTECLNFGVLEEKKLVKQPKIPS